MSLLIRLVIRKPDKTKNMSTPKKPPLNDWGKPWYVTTSKTAIARSPSISRRYSNLVFSELTERIRVLTNPEDTSRIYLQTWLLSIQQVFECWDPQAMDLLGCMVLVFGEPWNCGLVHGCITFLLVFGHAPVARLFSGFVLTGHYLNPVRWFPLPPHEFNSLWCSQPLMIANMLTILECMNTGCLIYGVSWG